MKKRIAITLFVLHYYMLYCMEEAPLLQKHSFTNTIAQEVYHAVPSYNLAIKTDPHIIEKRKKRFDAGFSLYLQGHYADTQEIGAIRFLGNEAAHQQLLLDLDVPTLLGHGAAFFNDFKKEGRKGLHFQLAYMYLYLGAQKGDAFCEHLFGHLLYMNEQSEEAKNCYQKYGEYPNQALKYVTKSKYPHIYWNSFKKIYETIFFKPKKIFNRYKNSYEHLDCLGSFHFAPAQEKQLLLPVSITAHHRLFKRYSPLTFSTNKPVAPTSHIGTFAQKQYESTFPEPTAFTIIPEAAVCAPSNTLPAKTITKILTSSEEPTERVQQHKKPFKEPITQATVSTEEKQLSGDDIVNHIQEQKKCSSKEEASALFSHEVFKNLLENEDKNMRYKTALWLGTHSTLIPEAKFIKKKLLKALAKEDFVPAQIELLPKNSTKTDHLEDIEKIIPLIDTNLFTLYPACKTKLQESMRAFGKFAEKDPRIAGWYAGLVSTGIPGMLKKNISQAWHYFLMQKPTQTAKSITLFEKALKETSDANVFIKGHTWFSHYYAAKNDIQKACSHAQALLDKKFEKKVFIEQIVPEFNKHGAFSRLLREAQKKYDADATILYSELIQQLILHTTKLDTDTSKPIDQWKSAYGLLKKSLESNQESPAIKKQIGQLCSIVGDYFFNNDDRSCAKAIFAEGALYEDPFCEYRLGYINLNFPEEKNDTTEGIKLLTQATLHNNKEAALILGKYCILGLPFTLQASHALFLLHKKGYSALEKACELGSQEAEELLPTIRKPKDISNQPENINDHKACYEYALSLFDDLKPQEALAWFNHAAKSTIPQVNFYRGCIEMINFDTASETKIKRIHTLFCNALEKKNMLSNKSEYTQLVGAALRGLIFLSRSKKHIPSTITAINHLADCDFFPAQELCLVLESLCSTLFETYTQSELFRTEIAKLFKHQLEKIGTLAIKHNNRTLGLTLCSINKWFLESHVFFTEKCSQIINAKKIGKHFLSTEEWYNLDALCPYSFLQAQDYKNGLACIELLEKDNLHDIHCMTAKAAFIIEAYATDPTKYLLTEALNSVEAALKKDQKRAGITACIAKRATLKLLSDQNPKEYEPRYTAWCKQLNKSFGSSNVDRVSTLLTPSSMQRDKPKIEFEKKSTELIQKPTSDMLPLATLIELIKTNLCSEKPNLIAAVSNLRKAIDGYRSDTQSSELHTVLIEVLLGHVYHALQQQKHKEATQKNSIAQRLLLELEKFLASKNIVYEYKFNTNDPQFIIHGNQEGEGTCIPLDNPIDKLSF